MVQKGRTGFEFKPHGASSKGRGDDEGLDEDDSEGLDVDDGEDAETKAESSSERALPFFRKRNTLLRGDGSVCIAALYV